MTDMIFLRTEWMKYYKGPNDDCTSKTSKFVKEHGFGYEMYNFLPYNGYMYGLVAPKETINIDRIGASKGDCCIDGILAVWTAPKYDSECNTLGGVVIVGWYKNATILRKEIKRNPHDPNRKYGEEYELTYNVKAKEEDCKLLPVDKRTCEVPASTKGEMGRSYIWYADSDIGIEFREKVLRYISENS